MLLQQFGTSSSVYTDIQMLEAYNNGISIYGLSTGLMTLNEIQSSDFTSRTLILTDIFNGQDNINSTLNQRVIVSIILSLHDELYVLQKDIVTENALLTDSVSILLTKIEHILELLNLDEINSTQINAINVISVVLALLDNINFATKDQIIEQLILNDNILNLYKTYVSLLDGMLFTGDIPPGNSLAIILTDKMNFTDNISISAILKSILTDGINLLGSLNFDGAQYFACVLNTQSTGISEYSNFNFNSFSWPLAAAADGIYELKGDTHDGKPIISSIKTGLIDFGTNVQKQVPYAYLAITQTGRVIMKVTSHNRGVKKERWYEVNSSNNAVDTTRVQFGRGVKSKYWQFELTNIDGDKFSLDSMEVLPLLLSRRI